MIIINSMVFILSPSCTRILRYPPQNLLLSLFSLPTCITFIYRFPRASQFCGLSEICCFIIWYFIHYISPLTVQTSVCLTEFYIRFNSKRERTIFNPFHRGHVSFPALSSTCSIPKFLYNTHSSGYFLHSATLHMLFLFLPIFLYTYTLRPSDN